MANSINIVFQDPILLAASLVLVATIVILVWAIKTLSSIGYVEEDSLHYEDEPSKPSEYEATGLHEARLQEISNQLNSIDLRLVELEKSIKDTNSSTTELPDFSKLNLASMSDIEKFVQRIDSRLELIASEENKGPANVTKMSPEDIDRIETKLDSIRKLLVLITDSGT